jgi:hypothetical protein
MPTWYAPYARARPRTIRHAVRTTVPRILAVVAQSPKMTRTESQRPSSTTSKVTPPTAAMVSSRKTLRSMAGIIARPR